MRGYAAVAVLCAMISTYMNELLRTACTEGHWLTASDSNRVNVYGPPLSTQCKYICYSWLAHIQAAAYTDAIRPCPRLHVA